MVAALVPKGARLADVGTDHAYLPIRLLQRGVVSSAVASDIRPGPLRAAEKNRDACGVPGLRCVLCDGLDGISPQDADTVVIAGMGGETIVDILRRAPWAAREARLILQPMSRPDVLRAWLCDNGVRILGEHLAFDHGRLYQAMEAERGEASVLSACERYTGAYGLISRDPLFPELLDHYEKKFSIAAEGAGRSGTEREEAARWQRLLAEIGEMRRMYHAERI